MMKDKLVVLASASPRRAQLLRQLEIKFEVVASDAPETRNEQLTARELVLLNAYRKARAVAKKMPDAVVVGADTVVCVGPELLGKPKDRAEAAAMLSLLQGQTHQVITGVCLLHLRTHRERIFAECTDVTFRPLTADEIQCYLNRIDPLDKAGAYAIQEHGEQIVKQIAGSLSNVVGLPLEKLTEELQRW